MNNEMYFHYINEFYKLTKEEVYYVKKLIEKTKKGER